jgi:hypothetical protein
VIERAFATGDVERDKLLGDRPAKGVDDPDCDTVRHRAKHGVN